MTTKKNRLVLVLVALLFFIITAAAQDKKASAILDDLKEKTQSYKTIKMIFSYSLDNENEDIHESFDGELLLKGNKYRLSIAGQEVICDGESTWTYIQDAEEIQINSIEDDDEALTPNNLFTSYYDNYKSKFNKEYEENGRTIQVIDLTPLEGKSYSKIQLLLIKETLHFDSFIIYDKNGNLFTYKVIEFIPNMVIDDEKFVFNAEDYPDAEVIDMR
ncbi:MAG: outer membrane lipoprotein carrier protein LolA [Bacteroidales bacterium]|nr:outer membrane lipoprotein carrier protein LolA [Bacteroidales bacterium]